MIETDDQAIAALNETGKEWQLTRKYGPLGARYEIKIAIENKPRSKTVYGSGKDVSEAAAVALSFLKPLLSK